MRRCLRESSGVVKGWAGEHALANGNGDLCRCSSNTRDYSTAATATAAGPRVAAVGVDVNVAAAAQNGAFAMFRLQPYANTHLQI